MVRSILPGVAFSRAVVSRVATGVCWLMLVAAGAGIGVQVSAEPGSVNPDLSAPTQDARDHYGSGKVEFVGIQLEDKLEIPGLKKSQLAVVADKYPVRALNHRWKTYTNIEKQPQEYRRLHRYAVRYNLMMWKLENSPTSDRFKYRY